MSKSKKDPRCKSRIADRRCGRQDGHDGLCESPEQAAREAARKAARATKKSPTIHFRVPFWQNEGGCLESGFVLCGAFGVAHEHTVVTINATDCPDCQRIFTNEYTKLVGELRDKLRAVWPARGPS